ncbi:MAG: PDZ domain-containing protein [Salinibacterium sp.]|nr:PDZ domain-containing protein [Salinibacterium sp.]
MRLFTDIEPDAAPRRRRARIGWAFLAAALIGLTAVAVAPAPYVIEQPGPVYNTLGDVTAGDKSVTLISIPSEKTYPTAGSLDMLTVSIRGNRANLPNWFEVAAAYLDPSRAVVDIDRIYPVGQTVEQSNQQGATEMANSQKSAIAAALTELGYTLPTTLTAVEIEPGYPADGKLMVNDVIVSVNGATFADVSQLRDALLANGADAPATIDILRDGQPMSLQVTPVLSTGDNPAPVLGILVGSEYDFPFTVTIQLENVGGPSAGMMFALGIIDKLTPGELNGGKDIAGTGTIDATGVVGAIGGIRQKMYGAVDAGATYFLAPADNCNEVTGHIPPGLTVFAVKTLDDSLAALKAISSGGDTTDLPHCPLG